MEWESNVDGVLSSCLPFAKLRSIGLVLTERAKRQFQKFIIDVYLYLHFHLCPENIEGTCLLISTLCHPHCLGEINQPAALEVGSNLPQLRNSQKLSPPSDTLKCPSPSVSIVTVGWLWCQIWPMRSGQHFSWRFLFCFKQNKLKKKNLSSWLSKAIIPSPSSPSVAKMWWWRGTALAGRQTPPAKGDGRGCCKESCCLPWPASSALVHRCMENNKNSTTVSESED